VARFFADAEALYSYEGRTRCKPDRRQGHHRAQRLRIARRAVRAPSCLAMRGEEGGYASR
jgi:hypothetical protein